MKKVVRKQRIPLLALVVAVVIWPQVASAASVVANPGPIQLSLTSGSFNLGATEVQLPLPATLTGTIDASGNILIPQAKINFTPVNKPIKGVNTTIRIQATHPANGQLDPSTGQAALRIRFRLKIETPPGLLNVGSNCFLGTATTPIDLNKISTSASGGAKYNATTGTIALGNTTFSVPNSAGCGALGNQIDSGLGLPSESGRNKITLAFKVSSQIKSGGAAIVGGVSDHEQGAGLAPDTVLADPQPTGSGEGSSSNQSGTDAQAGLGNGTGSSLSAQGVPLRAKVGTARAQFDDGVISLYVGCDGSAGSYCRGIVRLTMASGRHAFVGARRYRIEAGDMSAVDVTARLGRRALRSHRPAKLVAQLKSADGALSVKRQLRLKF